MQYRIRALFTLALLTITPGVASAGVKKCEKIKPAQALPIDKQVAVATVMRAKVPGLPVKIEADNKVDTKTEFSVKHLSDDALAKGWATYQLCVLKENGTISAAIYDDAMRKLFGVEDGGSTDSGVANHPNTVAVMYFDNRSDEKYDALRLGLAQMIISDLQGPTQYSIVERERLEDILKELALNQSNKIDPSSAARAGKLLGAEWLVVGSFFEMMGTFRIDARLIKTETGEVLHAKGVNGAATDFMAMEKDLASDLSSALLAEVADNEVANAAKADILGRKVASKKTGKELDAMISLSEGLRYKDAGDSAKARAAFEKALELDPQLKVAKRQLSKLGG